MEHELAIRLDAIIERLELLVKAKEFELRKEEQKDGNAQSKKQDISQEASKDGA